MRKNRCHSSGMLPEIFLDFPSFISAPGLKDKALGYIRGIRFLPKVGIIVQYWNHSEFGITNKSSRRYSMIKHCFIKSPHQRYYTVFWERRWNTLRTEQSGFIVDFQFHHPTYNNSHNFSVTTLLYRENVNKECYSDVFL